MPSNAFIPGGGLRSIAVCHVSALPSPSDKPPAHGSRFDGHTVGRSIAVTLVAAVLLLTLIGCGSDENDWLKQQDEAVKEQGDLGLLGGKPSDEDIRKACRVLKRNDWDHEYALEAAAISLELAMLKHLDAMHVVLGDDVQDYCEAKLAES